MMRTMKNAALYARVSTRNNGQNPETQLLPLREYAQNRSLAVVEEFVDHGVSGAKERRPRLDALMAAARKGQFDAVIVWKFDRFARSTRHLVQALEEFQGLGIHFISLTEAIDTSTPMGRMVFTVLGAVAELERSLICERVASGLARARKQGKQLGRPKVIVDHEQVRKLQKGGLSVRAIAAQLQLSKSTVHSIVTA
jgi:DNA invertase Pin-like site-specific DNA recombinase